MTYPQGQGGYGPPQYGAPQQMKAGPDLPGFVAPLGVGVLGVIGVLLGLSAAFQSSSVRGASSDTASFYESSFVWPIALVFIAGLIAIVGLILKERSFIGISGALSVGTVILMLFHLSNDVDTAWGYWLVFVLALVQGAIATIAILFKTGVIGGVGRPQYGQPQYGQSQFGQPQYGQPQQYGQRAPGYGQPAPQPGAQPTQGQPPQYGQQQRPNQ